MITVWEKRPGRWKVSGDSKVYPSREAATLAAADRFEIVTIQEPVEEITIAEEVDPLEALRKARTEHGDIPEGSDHDGDYEEQELSESPDRGLLGSTWD